MLIELDFARFQIEQLDYWLFIWIMNKWEELYTDCLSLRKLPTIAVISHWLDMERIFLASNSDGTVTEAHLFVMGLMGPNQISPNIQMSQIVN